MEERRKSTPSDDVLILDLSADEAERASALSRLAVDKITRLEPEVVTLLRDPAPMVRGEAIRALLSAWRLDAYLETAITILHSDRDETVRTRAARALSSFVLLDPDPPQVTPQHRDAAFAALLRSFLRDGDSQVQRAAYRGIHEMVTGRQPPLPAWFDREADTDWALLAPYLPAGEVRPARPRPEPISTAEDGKLLSDPLTSPEALAAAIDRIEADRRYELGPAISRLRHHDSALVRGRALLALTRTWRRSNVDRIEDMLRSDPEWEARAGAAQAVPFVLRTYPSFRESTRELLLDALIRENDERVEAAIKEAIERVDDPAFPPGPVRDDVTGTA